MKKLNGARWLLVTLLVIDILIASLALMHRRFGATFLEGTQMLPAPALESITWFVENNLLIFSSLGWVLIVGTAIVGWMESAYALVQDELPDTAPAHAEWTLMAWIVPVISLYKPYQLLRELYRCGDPAAASSPLHLLPSSPGLLVWWLLYRPAHFVYVVLAAGILVFFATGIVVIPRIDIEEQITALLAIAIATSIAWLAVVNMLTARLIYAASQKERVKDLGFLASVYRREPQIEPVEPPAEAPVERAPARKMAIAKPTFSEPSFSEPAFSAPEPAFSAPEPARMDVRRAPVIDSDPSPEEPMPLRAPSVGPAFNEAAAYTRIAEEMDTKQWEKGTWLRALVESGNDAAKQPLLYAKLRLAQLRSEHVARQIDLQEQQEREERERIAVEEATQRRREAEHYLMGQFHVQSASTLDETAFLEVIQLAIAENRVNQRSRSSGKTLLHMAIERLGVLQQRGSRETGGTGGDDDEQRRALRAIQQLLGAGADPLIRDRAGQTSHDYARANGIHLRMLQ